MKLNIIMESNLLSPFGPVLLSSLGCMDPGRWATAIEGGSRFGSELVWVMILSNIWALLFQWLSSLVGLVTRRNLAEICREEYPLFVRFLLWLQCEFSVVMMDLTMVLAIAMGTSNQLGLHIVPCILFTIVDVVVLWVLISYQGMSWAKVFTASLVSMVLVCFVADALGSHAVMPALVFGILPKLKRESLYTVISVFGANIVPVQIYLRSAFSYGSGNNEDRLKVRNFLFKDGGFTLIVSILVNLAVLSSAAATFHNSGLLVIGLQDAQALMDQALSNTVTPATFALALLCSGQLSTLSGSIGGQIALEGFLGVRLPVMLHRILIKAAAIVAAFLFVWNSGSEGTYQALIFCQFLLALQLPLSVVPLIKVASSRVVMGPHKISTLMESFAWVFVASMVLLSMWLGIDMVVGDSDEWAAGFNFVRGSGLCTREWGSAAGVSIVASLAIAVALCSVVLLVWMVLHPFTLGVCCNEVASSEREKVQEQSKLDPVLPSVVEDEDVVMIHNQVQLVRCQEENRGDFKKDDDDPLYLLLKDEDKSFLSESSSLGEAEDLGDAEFRRSWAATPIQDFTFVDSTPLLSSFSVPAESPLVELSKERLPVPEAFIQLKHCEDDTKADPLKDDLKKGLEMRGHGEILGKEDDNDNDNDVWENMEHDEDSSSAVDSLSKEPGSSIRSVGSWKSDAGSEPSGSGSGSVSRLSGLGRAARRQYAASLDDFWAKLFDRHGQLISRPDGSNSNNRSQVRESTDIRHGSKASKPRALDNPLQPLSLAPSSSSSSSSSSSLNLLHQGRSSETMAVYPSSPLSQDFEEEMGYPNFQLPSYHDRYDPQPATIHGYKSLSYVGRAGSFSPGPKFTPSYLEGERRDPVSLPSSFWSASRSFSPYNLPNPDMEKADLRETMQNAAIQPRSSSQWRNDYLAGSSLGQAHTSNRFGAAIGGSQLGLLNPYDGSSRWDTAYSGKEKGAWDSLVYRATGELDMSQNSLVSSRRYGCMPAIGRGQNFESTLDAFSYQNARGGYRAPPPLSFDELSPSQSRKDAFSIPASTATTTSQVGGNHSLWSRQPFDELFGGLPSSAAVGSNRLPRTASGRVNEALQDASSAGIDWELNMLKNLRECLRKLLRLDGTEWLFRAGSGADENLIAVIAVREKVLLEAESRVSESSQFDHTWPGFGRQDSRSSMGSTGVPHCGEGCVWSLELLISFGVWCVHRILELSLMESRPELWGKYTYVLNRLQGILEPAFGKSSRSVPPPCICLQNSPGKSLSPPKQSFGEVLFATSNGHNGGYSTSPLVSGSAGSACKVTSAAMLVDIVKEVEAAISSRKGRTGTAAGDIAFPKGKENLASVLKRYKRRLGQKLPPSTANRKVQS